MLHLAPIGGVISRNKKAAVSFINTFLTESHTCRDGRNDPGPGPGSDLIKSIEKFPGKIEFMSEEVPQDRTRGSIIG
jgi:hypothetical protein